MFHFPLWSQIVATAAFICMAVSGLSFHLYMMPRYVRWSSDAEPEGGESS